MSASTPLRVSYDAQFDILEIFFQTEPTLTIELEEDIYAHVVPATRQVIGLTVHHFRRNHAQFAVPFRCTLVPASSVVAKKIEQALLRGGAET
jgi:uncharacterized protein YuzE